MYHLLMNLPSSRPWGLSPCWLGRWPSLSIDAGAWVLERCVYAGARVLVICVHGRRQQSELACIPRLLATSL